MGVPVSIYLILVLLTLPSAGGQPGPTAELHREWITASTAAVC